MFFGRAGRAAALAAALVSGPVAAEVPAGGISVSPVRLDLGQNQRSAAVTIANGDTARVVQVEAFRWSRVNGEDVYVPADDLIVNPPMFRLGAGAKQVVRVGLAAPDAATAGEQAYRVYFQEVPDQATAAAPDTQLQMVLRLGVPVFIAPEQASRDLRWSAQRTDEGLRLELRNAGNVHARLTDLSVMPAAAGAKPVGSAPGLRYVFPGETYSWTFPLGSPLPEQAVQVAAQSDRGPIHAEIALGSP